MNLNELEERLQLLSDQGVITQKAYDIAILSFKKLLHVLNTENMEQAEMLFTHLPMALSRIERDEEVDNPIEGALDEVKNSFHFPEAEKQVAYIEEEWEGALPEGEKGFLYMHYTNVIHLNSGEEVK